MPVRRDRRNNTRRPSARERKTRFAFTFLVLFGMVAFFALMRYVSRPFMDGDRTLDAPASPSAFAYLNPWRVDDDSTQTYVSGDGARFDPLAPDSDGALLADASDDPAAQSEIAFRNEGETTKPGADFADLEIPDGVRDDVIAMDWGRNVEQSWYQQTDLSRPRNYSGLDFEFTPTVPGEFASKTLTVDGKPTYTPDATLSQSIVDNAAAEAIQTQPAKVALNPEDEPRRPEMTPAEKIQPGVVFIPSGYRRGGVAQASGSGAMGRVSTIVR